MAIGKVKRQGLYSRNNLLNGNHGTNRRESQVRWHLVDTILMTLQLWIRCGERAGISLPSQLMRRTGKKRMIGVQFHIG